MCLIPITLERDTDFERKVPCGRCIKCKKANSRSWLFRLQQEVRHCQNSWYVTFTYNNDNLPEIWSDQYDRSIMTLDYEDVKKFFKRLRFNYNLNNVRYFLVGEYGKRFGRPHYHAVIFNVPDPKMIIDTWKHGFVDISKFDVSLGGGSYLTKYLCKDVNRKTEERVKEKLLVSKGFGAQYLTDAIIQWHNENPYQNSYVVSQGVKTTIPKYYKEKLFHENRYAREEVASAMQDMSRKKFEKEFNDLRMKYPTLSEQDVNNLLNSRKMNDNYLNFEKQKVQYYGKKSRQIWQ